MNDNKATIQQLKNAIDKFVKDRNWDEFQNIRSLAISLSLESNELLDHFQWLSDKEVADFEENKESIDEIKEELADILSYILIAANRLNIDISSTFLKKLEKNSKKYPAEEFKELDREQDNKLYKQKRKEWESSK